MKDTLNYDDLSHEERAKVDEDSDTFLFRLGWLISENPQNHIGHLAQQVIYGILDGSVKRIIAQTDDCKFYSYPVTPKIQAETCRLISYLPFEDSDLYDENEL